VGLDDFCSSDQWSMLASAATLSSLAAALGAFLVTAITLYLKGEVRESVHTMALFSSAVLILVLSAFVFSLVAGTTVTGGGDRRAVCAVAWTQGALATGMLAAGATALFGGLGWILAGHAATRLSEHTGDDDRGYAFLSRLGSWLTFAAAMSTTLLVSEISIDFLHFMFAGAAHRWLVGTIVVATALVVLSSLVFVGLRTRSAAAEPTASTLRALKVATVGIVALGVVATWMAMTLARFPDGWLTAPSPATVCAVLLLAFALPGVIAVAICYSAPTVATHPQKRNPA
jgi:hypothetical protein